MLERKKEYKYFKRQRETIISIMISPTKRDSPSIIVVRFDELSEDSL